MFRTLCTAATVGALAAFPAVAEKHDMAKDGDMSSSSGMADNGYVTAARADIMDRDGNSVGTVTINRTVSGLPLVIVALQDVPEGTHGIHLHETGDCSADDFTSAGGHIPGDAQHGVLVEGGPHPGDLPNAVAQSDGLLTVEVFNDRLDIESMIFDGDGAAFIMHAGEDDYMSQPAGDSGDRIACGVFEKA